MSHYTVAVFHRKDQDIDDLLAPYDENMSVEPYIKYTMQEAIDWVKKNIAGYHDKPDFECWQWMADEYDGRTDDEGNIYSTYNPDSKWDWYSIGGRWSGEFIPEDEAIVKDIDFSMNKEDYEQALKFWKENVDGGTDTEPQRSMQNIAQVSAHMRS